MGAAVDEALRGCLVGVGVGAFVRPGGGLTGGENAGVLMVWVLIVMGSCCRCCLRGGASVGGVVTG